MEILPTDPTVQALGRVLQRMAERTRDEPAYLPHPIAIAVAEAVRAGNLTDGDGTFGAQEHLYQVHMSKAHGHFAILNVANLRTGKLLPAAVVLRLLAAHDALAGLPGSVVPADDARDLLAQALDVEPEAAALLLRKQGQGDVPKAALLELLEAMPP